MIQRCAELHLDHIATSGDPFELGSARPLDFGHWSAHKLEQLSNFQIRHGEAVAIGIALDVIYSRNIGLLDAKSAERILGLARTAWLRPVRQRIAERRHRTAICRCSAGLEEFREHLGGELTITLLKEIGRGVEVHEMNLPKMVEAIHELRERHRASAKNHPRQRQMNRLAVINVVGLTESLIGEHTPRIAEFRQRGALAHIAPAFPAVTCTAQSNYLTGKTPSQHGIVGNGWFNRELAEVQFWKQSNHLVQGPKIWDALRDNDLQSSIVTRHVANCSGGSTCIPPSIIPSRRARCIPPMAGRFSTFIPGRIPSATEIKRDLGEFPFFGFWGPAAGIKTPQGAADCATRWIAESAKWIENKYSPTLNLIYLPHLDYNLQRHGPFAEVRAVSDRRSARTESTLPTNPKIHSRDLRAIDAIVGDLIDFFGKRGVQVVLLSEYGITNVDTPVHLNRIFRSKAGWR